MNQPKVIARLWQAPHLTKKFDEMKKKKETKSKTVAKKNPSKDK